MLEGTHISMLLFREASKASSWSEVCRQRYLRHYFSSVPFFCPITNTLECTVYTNKHVEAIYLCHQNALWPVSRTPFGRRPRGLNLSSSTWSFLPTISPVVGQSASVNSPLLSLLTHFVAFDIYTTPTLFIKRSGAKAVWEAKYLVDWMMGSKPYSNGKHRRPTLPTGNNTRSYMACLNN